LPKDINLSQKFQQSLGYINYYAYYNNTTTSLLPVSSFHLNDLNHFAT